MVVLGAVLQYTIMPSVGYAISRLWGLSPAYSVGYVPLLYGATCRDPRQCALSVKLDPTPGCRTQSELQRDIYSLPNK